VQANTVTLSGTISSIEPLRHTPAGLPLVRFRLQHRSTQAEAGISRQVECEVGCVGMGNITAALSTRRVGEEIQVTGFLSKAGRNSSHLTLHVLAVE